MPSWRNRPYKLIFTLKVRLGTFINTFALRGVVFLFDLPAQKSPVYNTEGQTQNPACVAESFDLNLP